MREGANEIRKAISALNSTLRLAKQMVSSGMSLTEAGKEIKKAMLAAALRKHKGNLWYAARSLSVHPKTLARWMARSASQRRASLLEGPEQMPASGLRLKKSSDTRAA